MNNWEFHFRNFSPTGTDLFGVYHAGCGGVPWRDGRPNCWSCNISSNPTGGQSSVYLPADFVVNFGAWFNVILEGLKEVAEIGLAIATDGEDVAGAISGVFDVEKAVVEAVLAQNQMSTQDLSALLSQNFEKACSIAGQSPDRVKQYAAQMGLGSWAFLSGGAYVNNIQKDNKDVNGGWGFTVLHSKQGAAPDYRAQAAFIESGHLIYLWDPANLGGFWEPYT